ncbi:MAG TPA: methyltransferase domain-containing protein [Burkholderiaceae bacterium]|nr:methyltransferase domain-containing protein [Burkholderiaceae bacterium]
MSSERPPTIDPQAARRWADLPAHESPWLHEEVARRMEERLQWIKLQPASWAHWEPVRGGLQTHAALARRYPDAASFVVEAPESRTRVAAKSISKPWWSLSRWREKSVQFQVPPDASVQMLWANMALHMSADPQALIAQWHRALATDGFLMFSCLGPDTLKELRNVYQVLGWPAPSHEFTDMHDWGDMLVNAGFAEPVMDMERITLTFESPLRLLAELRQLGRNFHQQRFAGLRGRRWLAQLHASLQQGLAAPGEGGRLQLTFEIIYGHALKPQPRFPVSAETRVSVDEMRSKLRQGRGGDQTT